MVGPLVAPSPERWAAIQPVLDRALDMPAAARAGFIAEACAGDPALRGEVERLLAAGEAADDFLSEPAASFASPLVAWVAARQALSPGEWLGSYLIEDELGRGGMADVYLAHDPKHGRRVALKVLRPELCGLFGAQRFSREIAIAARLNHPHVLALFDSGTLESDDGAARLFYTMPYVAGRSLRTRLCSEPPLRMDEAIAIARDVAAAIDYAHRHGIVHRDIKPENILLAEDAAVVADFGIARALDSAAFADGVTGAGLVLGTPAYMSPEQARGGTSLDGRTDLYALGCVVYEMLAGQPPFPAPTPQAIMSRHAVDPVPPLRTLRPTVPAAVQSAIEVALAKAPEDRFATAGEFIQALEGTREVGSTKRAAGVRGGRLALAGLLALIAIAAALLMHRRPGTPPGRPDLIAILPFRVAGAARNELAWLREGLVDLLAARLADDSAVRIADPRRVGAGRIISGSVVGTSGHLTITATMSPDARGSVAVPVTVDGPADSLAPLVDQLAGQLLALHAGVEPERLAGRWSRSLPAVRAYLKGRAAFRAGRLVEAFNNYRDATLFDSTFALAALELLHASKWVALEGAEARRARQLALAGRDRLAPSDQALLDAWAVSPQTLPEIIRRWRVATTAYPGRADFWYGLGDAYYHHGMLAGVTTDDPMRLAMVAFRRGWALDSSALGDSLGPARSPTFAEALNHMVEIALTWGDTATVFHLAHAGLAVDSTSAEGWYLRWQRAVALGEPARRAFWADSLQIEPATFTLIHRFILSSGVATEDYQRSAERMVRQIGIDDPDAVPFERHLLAMNGGRPREGALAMGGHLNAASISMGLPIREALYWGGDTTAALDAVRRLTPVANGLGVRRNALQDQLHSLCAVASWRLAHGDVHYAEAAAKRLRGTAILGLGLDSLRVAQYVALCAALLDGARATVQHLPEARALLELADSAARTYDVAPSLGANLVVARAAERQGYMAFALRALRRRAQEYEELPAFYLSTFLAEEGRIAALTGDTTEAVRAYRHYLALRPDPEPSVQGEVNRIRRELAALEGGDSTVR